MDPTAEDSGTVCIILVIIYTVYIDWKQEDWEFDENIMWSSCSLFDICMSCSNIIFVIYKKIN